MKVLLLVLTLAACAACVDPSPQIIRCGSGQVTVFCQDWLGRLYICACY